MRVSATLPATLLFVALVAPAEAVRGQSPSVVDSTMTEAVAALSLRSIGPAVMGGRIADIAVSAADRSTWYIAAGSGGVWKTTNAGTTWTPVFDDQPSYSVGVVTTDPTNADIVWVGTGENVSGRHVGWGDGVYRSPNGGQTWRRMGLEDSEHIGKILVHPEDGNVVYVAAEGPLWASGGERGVFKTTDAGESWTQVLEIDEDTGVTDLEFDPSNPDVLYAAAYQRRRHIWSLLAGGPQSGIYKTTDAGQTWRRIERGLPEGDMGKIGLAVTEADPSVVYATIEAGEDERGFYRSGDKGESWEHQNSYLSGGTGPHYYQEIEASPHDPDLVIQMDVFFHVTRDGGETFDYLETGRTKHSDNHALWIDPDDGRHLLGGTDAGLYESFDQGVTWRHFPNLPISQFYKVALSNDEPFYDILGGAQDLGTLLGPSRTMNVEGVRNRDWYAPMGADGYGVAIDPTDPSTLYLETQVGNLYRYDRTSEEALRIQPQPRPGDPPERWNWDAPILISPHASDRLYFGSQRVWRSDDRGDSWTPVSGDLTRNQNRYELELMDRVWSVDALYDNGAMSMYSTITAISESPVEEGVLYVGTDDGLIQTSHDGGGSWAAAAELPGVPPLSFVNDIEASQHDAETVFAVADAHKVGDFSPYVFESGDGGETWTSIRGDLPSGTIVWAIQQDHMNPELLFLAAEFGLYASTNGGTNWIELGGTPTISFRDLKIHRRDGDLVGATFGRGFYVLDDYGPLREIADGALSEAATLFGVRDAWWYVPNVPMQARGKPTLGSTDYTARNPPFGATFTYYLRETPATLRDARRAAEQLQSEQGADVSFPGYDRLQAEAVEAGPRVLLHVRDGQGRAVRWVEGPAENGLHRVSWDLRGAPPNPISVAEPGFVPPWQTSPQGPLVAPGEYEVELMLISGDGLQALAPVRRFTVKPVPTLADGTDVVAATDFQREVSDLQRAVLAAGRELSQATDALRHMKAALVQAPEADPALALQADSLIADLADLDRRLSGDPVRSGLNEPSVPSVSGRISYVVGGHWDTRQNPTQTQRDNIEIARGEFEVLLPELRRVIDERVSHLADDVRSAGAPWSPGPPR